MSDHDPSACIAPVPADRMPRIPPERMTPAQRTAAAELEAGPRGKVQGPYVPILRSPGFMTPAQKLGAYIRFECQLDFRINEMAALMTARHWTQQFEFHVHRPHALKAGLRAAIIDAIAEGRRPEDMASDEAVLYDFLTEVFATRGACDATYRRAVEAFGESGVIDILGIAGYYAMLAMIMNVARTALPDGAAYPLRPMPY
ncbi:MAG TPA: carboxymuconolactone decarboxylase family protein [Burkholderiales bacterium]